MSNTDPLLSRKELEEITEYKSIHWQIHWLTERGWKFEVGRTGRPKVLREERDRHMLGGRQTRAKQLNLAA